MFAFGVLLFRLLSGERPFPSNNSQILKRHTIELRYNVQGEDWESVSSSAKDLVRKLLINRQERLTAERALRHKWFSEIGESVLRPDRSTTRSHQDTSRSRAVVLVSMKIPKAATATSFVISPMFSACNVSRIRLKRQQAQWNEATEADFGLMVKWR
jgi:serine/threonine protein kinase